MKSKNLFTALLFLITIFSSAQTVFDDFERTGGLGSNWIVYFGAGSVNIVYDSDLGFTNGSTLFGIAAWTGTTLTADQYSEAVISPNRIDSMLTQVFVRRRTIDNARYGFHWDNIAASWQLKYDGVPTIQTRIMASLPAAEPLAGDTIRLEIQGMTLKGFHNGNLILTYTDTAFATSNPITTTGAPGMAYRFTIGFHAFYPQQVFEEWGAGNLVPTSISENTSENNFIVFPNPAKNIFTVELPKQKFDVIITDVTGIIFFEQNNITDKTQISCKDFSDGIYFVQVTKGKNVSNQKLIIVK
ncbi:MAG: T9SS type A sorting domain-containing protein [Saprospiraceae bacterium]